MTLVGIDDKKLKISEYKAIMKTRREEIMLRKYDHSCPSVSRSVCPSICHICGKIYIQIGAFVYLYAMKYDGMSFP